MAAQTAEKARVLYVDDDRQNLLVFRVAFKRYFDIRLAASAQEALQILDQEPPFAVILSDQRMPGMSGSEFLSKVKDDHPNTTRMVITAYTSLEDALKALNDGEATRFIHKPWKPQSLRADLEAGIELYESLERNRKLKEEMVASERLAAIGRMTSGFVHELSNLAFVLGIVDDLVEDWADEAEDPEDLETFRLGLAKLQLFADALRLCQLGDGALQLDCAETDITGVLRNAERLSRLFPPVRKLKRLDFRLPNAPITADLDGHKVEQVIINLVKNSAEACADDEGTVSVEVDTVGDSRIHVRVRDNGEGMSPEQLEQVRHGFYTSKDESGTGIGLMMSRRVLEAHGGELEIESEPGAGTTVTLSLPRNRLALTDAANDATPTEQSL